MEWLTNLLGFANNSGTSPWGAMGGSTALTPQGGGSSPFNTNMTGMGAGGGAPSWLPQMMPPAPATPPGATATPGMGSPSAGMPGPAPPNTNMTGAGAPMTGTVTSPPSMPFQLPGIFGKFLGQGQGGGAPNTNVTGNSGGQNFGLNQAMSLMKQPQMQQPNWMHLLSGPHGGGM